MYYKTRELDIFSRARQIASRLQRSPAQLCRCLSRDHTAAQKQSQALSSPCNFLHNSDVPEAAPPPKAGGVYSSGLPAVRPPHGPRRDGGSTFVRPRSRVRGSAAAAPGAAPQSFRLGGAAAAPLCFPSRPGARRARSRTRVWPRRRSLSPRPGRSRSAPRRGRRGGAGRQRKGEARPEPAVNSAPARRAPRGSEGPGRGGTAALPARPALPSRPASARPAAPSASPRPAGIPEGGGRHQPPRSPGAATFPGAVSAPRGAPGPGPGPGARAPSAASGLPGLRTLSARRAATCPRVAGRAAAAPAGPGRGRCSAPARAMPRRQRDLPHRPRRAASRSIMG